MTRTLRLTLRQSFRGDLKTVNLLEPTWVHLISVCIQMMYVYKCKKNQKSTPSNMTLQQWMGMSPLHSVLPFQFSLLILLFCSGWKQVFKWLHIPFPMQIQGRVSCSMKLPPHSDGHRTFIPMYSTLTKSCNQNCKVTWTSTQNMCSEISAWLMTSPHPSKIKKK